MTYQKRIGKIGEQIAADYLADNGYQVMDRNFTVPYGEIDLVAFEAEIVVFVEVKTRTSTTFGLPEDSVTAAKLERMHNAAILWLQAHPDIPDDWRIDVIAIQIDHQHNVLDLQHFINAYL
jgi:putative endonuclease